MPILSLSLETARRIALAAQGMNRARPGGTIDLARIRKTVQSLGLLQIDYVNVLVPAHYMVLFSRLGPYERPLLNRLLFEKHDLVEQWAHEASIVPVETWPLLEHRRAEFRPSKRFEAFERKHADYVQGVLDAAEKRGPVHADDFDTPPGVARHVAGAWRRSVPRTVLEHHFGLGHLVASNRRTNFSREYDLPERVVPRVHLGRRVAKEEGQRQLLLQAAQAQGIGAASDLADYWRMPMTQARPRLAELVEAKKLEKVAVDGWKVAAYLHPKARTPPRIAASALLSPFDPIVWTRDRLRRLYEFDYRLEIFVPAAKRKWGYYVVPFLHGDRLVARVDLKAERVERRLDVPSAHLEPHADAETVASALAVELHRLAGWLGLRTVRIGRRGNLARVLSSMNRAQSR